MSNQPLRDLLTDEHKRRLVGQRFIWEPQNISGNVLAGTIWEIVKGDGLFSYTREHDGCCKISLDAFLQWSRDKWCKSFIGHAGDPCIFCGL